MAKHGAPREPGVAPGSPRSRQVKVRALLAGGLVFGAGATLTLAAWTGTEAGRATFTAGTFTLASRTALADTFVSHGPGAPATVQVAAGAMKPGDTRFGWVQVQATGSIGGTLSLSAVSLAGAPLAGANLAYGNALTVTASASVQAGSGQAPCTATTPGTTVTGIGNIPNVPAVTLLPNAQNTATVCFVVTLSANAPNEAQGGQVQPTWSLLGSTG